MASRISLNGASVFSKQCLKQQWKNFSSQSSSHGGGPKFTPGNSFSQPPLSKPLAGLPRPVFSAAKDEGESTRVTTLPSGLRVASENRFGQFCTVGVVIDSGSRFEVSYPSGISHFLEKLAFNSTKQYDNKEIFQVLEKHGGICDCQSSRDTLVYAASADSRGFDAIVSILAEVVYRPKVTVEEVENVRQTIRFELETLMTRPEQEVILTDMIHAAAYRSNTLGLPKICPADNIAVIDRGTLLTYMRNHHTPARTVIAGVGIDHDALVESVQRHFEENKPIWESDVDLSELKLSDRLKADNSIAQYTGGLVKEECEIPQYVGPSGLPELAHVVVGMEGVSHQDPDFVPVCVLNMMMGGGGSFSAGGPGKGMYTRLYTNVLNRYHWMFSATAYNHSYADSGVFCVHASAPPPYVRDMLDVLLKEFATMAHSVSDTELRRAKTQLQSMLLMNLEARPVVFEDIARQVLATGHRKHPSVFIQAIESVTAADIERVTQRLLRSQPAVAARGAVQKLPTLQDIQAALLDSGSALGQRRNRLFTPK